MLRRIPCPKIGSDECRAQEHPMHNNALNSDNLLLRNTPPPPAKVITWIICLDSILCNGRASLHHLYEVTPKSTLPYNGRLLHYICLLQPSLGPRFSKRNFLTPPVDYRRIMWWLTVQIFDVLYFFLFWSPSLAADNHGAWTGLINCLAARNLVLNFPLFLEDFHREDL